MPGKTPRTSQTTLAQEKLSHGQAKPYSTILG